MEKEEILSHLEDDLANPGSQKSGEFLEEHALVTAHRALETGNREALVEAMVCWLRDRSEPRTMLAVSIAKELSLGELRAELRVLKAEIDDGRVFLPFYARRVDAALNALG